MNESKRKTSEFMGIYFDPSAIMRIARLAEISSWAVLVVYALKLLLSTGTFVLAYLRGFYPRGLEFLDMSQQILILAKQPFRGIVYFIGLQAIAIILLMFLDFEVNTRRAAR